MSYIPRILIQKESLAKHEDLFQKIEFGGSIRGGEQRKGALKFLTNVFYHGNEYDIFGIKCFECQPDFSILNANVRKIMTELDIKYCTLD